MNNYKHPIEHKNGKESAEYKEYANDFREDRVTQWTSIFYQCLPIVRLPDVHTVLEFGSGRKLTSSINRHFGIDHITVDVSDRFNPDHISSIANFNEENRKFDLVCSFQCLEHNPLEELSDLIIHMGKFTDKYLYVSLPYNGAWFSSFMSIRLPKIAFHSFWNKQLDGAAGPKIKTASFYQRSGMNRYRPHWWEVGRPGTSKKQVQAIFEQCGFKLIERKHNPFYPHHIFFLFKKV